MGMAFHGASFLMLSVHEVSALGKLRVMAATIHLGGLNSHTLVFYFRILDRRQFLILERVFIEA